MSFDEEKVKNQISKWLKSFGCEIYWEKKNDYGYPMFKVAVNGSGTVEKPDILIRRKNASYVCEVKDATSTGNVCNSFTQLIGYASMRDAVYRIGNDIINVDGYMVATQHSIKGHLFNQEFDVVIPFNSVSMGHKDAVIRGELPRTEHAQTHLFVRLLWRTAIAYSVENKIGALLSDQLNNNMSVKPLFQYKKEKYQGFEVWT